MLCDLISNANTVYVGTNSSCRINKKNSVVQILTIEIPSKELTQLSRPVIVLVSPTRVSDEFPFIPNFHIIAFSRSGI